MKRVEPIIIRAQHELAAVIERSLLARELSPDLYQRYLSMQYHLTRGVQRYFMTAAAHSSLSRRRRLRKFLVDFANEEELHYLVAANDLHKLSLAVLPEPFDVTLWHAYFSELLVERPFIRLGAACVLENISSGSARSLVKRALSASFLSRENTKFLVLHQHETLPHGEQIITALSQAALDESQLSDVVVGARRGAVMYIRMAEWALNPEALSTLADPEAVALGASENASIEMFQMKDLGDHAGLDD
jgi:hypothetical protein